MIVSSLKESFTNDYVAFHPSKDHVGDDFLAATLETDTTDRELCAFHPGDEEARQVCMFFVVHGLLAGCVLLKAKKWE